MKIYRLQGAINALVHEADVIANVIASLVKEGSKT